MHSSGMSQKGLKIIQGCLWIILHNMSDCPHVLHEGTKGPPASQTSLSFLLENFIVASGMYDVYAPFPYDGAISALTVQTHLILSETLCSEYSYYSHLPLRKLRHREPNSATETAWPWRQALWCSMPPASLICSPSASCRAHIGSHYVLFLAMVS